jgi:hypothetical protein
MPGRIAATEALRERPDIGMVPFPRNEPDAIGIRIDRASVRVPAGQQDSTTGECVTRELEDGPGVGCRWGSCANALDETGLWKRDSPVAAGKAKVRLHGWRLMVGTPGVQVRKKRWEMACLSAA